MDGLVDKVEKEKSSGWVDCNTCRKDSGKYCSGKNKPYLCRPNFMFHQMIQVGKKK